MKVSSLLSLLYVATPAVALDNSDAWIGRMDPHLSKSSNRIETFAFPNKKMFNLKDLGGSGKKEPLKPLYFKLRNKVAGDLAKDRSQRIHPHRYVFQGKDIKRKSNYDETISTKVLLHHLLIIMESECPLLTQVKLRRIQYRSMLAM